MADASWSRYDRVDCVRVVGAVVDATVAVQVVSTPARDGLPAMAGRVVREGDDLCFVPRFAFVAGTSYAVMVDGTTLTTLVRPLVEVAPTTTVTAIHPSAPEVPRNLLRFYVTFSAPMSEGFAASCIRVVDDHGETVAAAMLATEYELWDAERRRLTVLLDPARIKRGLVGHREIGYPIATGRPFRLVIDEAFRNAQGGRLVERAERRYEVGDDERRLVDPSVWSIGAPMAGSSGALAVGFDRPLDRGLLDRCLRVVGRDGRAVDGVARIGPGERSWSFTPRAPWASATYELVVDPVLEDIAGNSISRVFDRDLDDAGDDGREPRPFAVAFDVR